MTSPSALNTGGPLPQATARGHLLDDGVGANEESGSESDTPVIELRQIAGYVEASDLSEVILELGEGPDVSGSILVLPDSIVGRLQANNLPADPLRATLRARLAPLVPDVACAACTYPIVPGPGNLGNVMWRLTCNHNLHLHCLQPLGYPAHPHYHSFNDGQLSARTRIRGRQQIQQHNDRPIEKLEKAELIHSWMCPFLDCHQHYLSFLYGDRWYANTEGMTLQGQAVNGPIRVCIVRPGVYRLSAI